LTGWSIKSFKEGELIPLYYNKLFSDATTLQYAYSQLPFVCPPSGRKHPAAGITSGSSIALNLGEVLRGDRITMSDYELPMGEDTEIKLLCTHRVDKRGVERATELVRERYMVEWIVDNLPAATSFVTTDKSRKYYSAGFKLGHEEYDEVTGLSKYYINNHVTMVIRYRLAPGRAGERGERVVVGVEAYPKSIGNSNRNSTGLPYNIREVENTMELTMFRNATSSEGSGEAEYLDIPYSYSVYFREEESDNLQWANRWDMYFVPDEDSHTVHWLAIINSLVISGFLTALVAVIFTRTIRSDIKGYIEPSLEEGLPRPPSLRGKKQLQLGQLLKPLSDKSPSSLLEPVDGEDENMGVDDEGTGWKLISNDVFRPPVQGHFLAPLIGSGMQLVFMAIGLLVLSAAGILNPSFRGGYISAGVGLFVIAGVLSGYISSKSHSSFAVGMLADTPFTWRQNLVVTGALVPGLVFSAIFVLNFFVWAQASSTAIPFGTLISLLFLWLFVQLPLVFLGGWLATLKFNPKAILAITSKFKLFGRWRFQLFGARDHTPKVLYSSVNSLASSSLSSRPRPIPAQPWWLRKPQVLLVAGFVPFLVILIELMFVFKSVWLDKSGFYYMFGFLAFVGFILMVVVVESTIVVVYLQLCAEVSFAIDCFAEN
jgi:transmembrane 9 superfamily protein 2/4